MNAVIYGAVVCHVPPNGQLVSIGGGVSELMA